MTRKDDSRRFLLALVNHFIWSSLTVASRHLQVYAQPQTFDGQAVLCTSKFTSAALLATCGGCLCPESSICRDEGASGKTNRREESTDDELREESTDDDDSQIILHVGRASPQAPALRTKITYALAFGIVATLRAALNIASAKFTVSYYITAINSLTPLVVSIGDKVLLQAHLPSAIWSCIASSVVGCLVIAASQSPLMKVSTDSSDEADDVYFTFTTQDGIGCGLQFMSMCFSAGARLLMKRTENILTRNEAVQTNNVCNTVFPLLYTLSTNPRGWNAFRSMTWESFGAWLTVAVLVYTIGSTGQITLVRGMGPAAYSSLGAVRVLGSAVLSAVWLNEPVQNWMEWLGLSIIMCTMTLYTLASVDVRQSWQHLIGSRGVDATATNGTVNEDDNTHSREGIFTELVPLKDELVGLQSESKDIN